MQSHTSICYTVGRENSRVIKYAAVGAVDARGGATQLPWSPGPIFTGMIIWATEFMFIVICMLQLTEFIYNAFPSVFSSHYFTVRTLLILG